MSGLLAQLASSPLRLPFYICLAALFAVSAPILAAPQTVAPPGDLRDVELKPRLGAPQNIRLPFVSPAVAGFCIFALIGFYSALIPNVLADNLHLPAPIVAGAIVCALFGVAAITILPTTQPGDRVQRAGVAVAQRLAFGCR